MRRGEDSGGDTGENNEAMSEEDAPDDDIAAALAVLEKMQVSDDNGKSTSRSPRRGIGKKDTVKKGTTTSTTTTSNLLDASASAVGIAWNKQNNYGDNIYDSGSLFDDPPPREICLICLKPLPINTTDQVYFSCCGKTVCKACDWVNEKAIKEINEKAKAAAKARSPKKRRPLRLVQECCKLCKMPTPKDNDELLLRTKARMEANDAEGVYQMAEYYYNGRCGLRRNWRKAFELYLRSAKLCYPQACFDVSFCYSKGRGVGKDAEKEQQYLELAAKGGHVQARHNLGCNEYEKGFTVKAYKHWMIAASAGYDDSLVNIKGGFRDGEVTEEDYAKALCAHQQATNEMKSEKRAKYAAAKKAGLVDD